MKLFNGSGEYRAMWELTQGDRVRCPDRQIREVLTVHGGGQLTSEYVAVACTDGFGWENPGTSMVVVKYPAAVCECGEPEDGGEFGWHTVGDTTRCNACGATIK